MARISTDLEEYTNTLHRVIIETFALIKKQVEGISPPSTYEIGSQLIGSKMLSAASRGEREDPRFKRFNQVMHHNVSIILTDDMSIKFAYLSRHMNDFNERHAKLNKSNDLCPNGIKLVNFLQEKLKEQNPFVITTRPMGYIFKALLADKIFEDVDHVEVINVGLQISQFFLSHERSSMFKTFIIQQSNILEALKERERKHAEIAMSITRAAGLPRRGDIEAKKKREEREMMHAEIAQAITKAAGLPSRRKMSANFIV